nr:aminotransferase class I/II-fold pyridoxal phosphate-dependent enzyme [Mycobacterium sp. E3298]
MHETERKRAPLFEMLVHHADQDAVSFHVPGHKQRMAIHEDESARTLFAPLLPIDVTELSDTDDLHDPSGPIAQAQALAAQCFGAEETSLLVGGSTAGNLATILGVCEPGELLLVQRNVHKSIIHGLALAGARCVFLSPDTDEQSGIAVAPGVQTLLLAVEKYPEAKALILCSPNYYGMTADLKRLVDIAHDKGIPVLVDEAHGAHFGQHPDLPASALQAGADVVVQSTHKMLGAMTMGAMLHMQGELAPRDAIRQALRMVQSSSPSYPLLASIDLARRALDTSGPSLFDEALSVAREIGAALEHLPFEALAADDPLKLSLRDPSGRLTGFALQAKLEERGCLAEMADSVHTVLALGPGTRSEDGERLIAALTDIAKEVKESDSDGKTSSSPRAEVQNPEGLRHNGVMPIPEPIFIRRRISFTTAVPLQAAVGGICGEWIIPYPPGIPLLYPGERITPSTINELQRLAHAGARFQGASDESLSTIRVLTEGDHE